MAFNVPPAGLGLVAGKAVVAAEQGTSTSEVKQQQKPKPTRLATTAVSLNGSEKKETTLDGIVDALKAAKPGERGPLLVALDQKVGDGTTLTAAQKDRLKQVGAESMAWMSEHSSGLLSRMFEGAAAFTGHSQR